MSGNFIRRTDDKPQKGIAMKKIGLLMVGVLMVSLLLAGCGKSGGGTEGPKETTAPAATEPVGTKEENVTNTSSELVAPAMEWWDLYNPNGFDTFTAVIKNTNSVPVDVSYDLVYYKDGKEIGRSEYFTNFSILPGKKDIIWANFDIPKSEDVDDVKMENVTVTEATYGAIDGKYEYLGTDGNEALFNFEFDSKPTLATITFLLYNDNNGNGQCDKGEIVITSIAPLMEKSGTVSFDTDVFSYTDYEVYFTAY